MTELEQLKKQNEALIKVVGCFNMASAMVFKTVTEGGYTTERGIPLILDPSVHALKDSAQMACEIRELMA